MHLPTFSCCLAETKNYQDSLVCLSRGLILCGFLVYGWVQKNTSSCILNQLNFLLVVLYSSLAYMLVESQDDVEADELDKWMGLFWFCFTGLAGPYMITMCPLVWVFYMFVSYIVD